MAAWIVRSVTRNGEARFAVRWQSGRHEPQIHLGSFKTRGDAVARLEWANREYASGRIPDRHRILEPARRPTLSRAADEYLESRIDAADGSRRAYRYRARHVVAAFGGRDPATITAKDIQGWINRLAAAGATAPTTLRGYVHVLSQILGFAGVERNPCRERFRYPPRKRDKMRIPTGGETAAVLARIGREHAAVLRLLDASGLRISEAVALRWGDVDAERDRLLVREGKTASARRWVDGVNGALPFPRKGDDALVFQVSAGAVRAAIMRACRDLGVGPYSPHDWRHRHASKRLRDGMDPANLAARLGHSNPGITLGTYSHVVPPD